MPERLHKILMLNPPRIFQMLLKAVSPFVDNRTMDKLVPINGTPEEIARELEEKHNFQSETVSWIKQVAMDGDCVTLRSDPEDIQPPHYHRLFRVRAHSCTGADWRNQNERAPSVANHCSQPYPPFITLSLQLSGCPRNKIVMERYSENWDSH